MYNTYYIETTRNRAGVDRKSVVLYLSFAISCLSNTALLLWLIIIPIYLIARYKTEGALDFFIFLQLRSVLNPAVAVGFAGAAAYVKWTAVFLVSFYLWAGSKFMENRDAKHVVHLALMFSFASIVFAWLTSAYPVTASFKVLSYAIPFTAILIGVSHTSDINWARRIAIPLGVLCLGSFVLLFSSVGYIVNGTLFQGGFNHPNMFGIALGLFIAVALYDVDSVSPKSVALILLVLFLVYRSGCRTGGISVLIVVLIWLLSLSKRLPGKIAIITLLVLFVVVLFFLDAPLIRTSMSFLYKWGGNDVSGLLLSRSDQIDNGIARFTTSPLFGTGFNVPYRSGVRSYEFSFDLITENGNLILAVLGDTGILGAVLFINAYYTLYRCGRGVRATIFFAPFLVSMGEMAFFSTNNIAILMYLYFGIYACDGWKKRKADAL